MDSIKRFMRKKPLDCPVDLISDLPRDVIDEIMKRLPLRVAARMSVLSHKWQHIWLSTPQLVFTNRFFANVIQTNKEATNTFCNIISKLLLQHQGPIVKFSLLVPQLRDPPPDLIQWLCHLSRNGIKDFSLQNYYSSSLELSSHLFSCVELEHLNLRYCTFGAFNFSGLRKLVSLELHDITFEKGTFESLIACCFLLEKLCLSKCEGIEPYTIIDAPNLKHLYLTDHVLHVRTSVNLLSMSLSVSHSSVNVTKDFGKKRNLQELFDILANSTKLEKLSLDNKFVALLTKECRFCIAFERLRILELFSIQLSDLDDFYYVVGAISMCPNIRRLDISMRGYDIDDDVIVEYNPDIILPHLQWAQVVLGFSSSQELKLIEFMLACSPVLQTLIIHVKKGYELNILKQLTDFHRASTEVKIIGPHIYDYRSIVSVYDTIVSYNTSSSDSDSPLQFSDSDSPLQFSDEDEDEEEEEEEDEDEY